MTTFAGILTQAWKYYFSAVLDRTTTENVIGKMKVISVLENLPGYGKVKARKVMEKIGITDTRRLQGLGSNKMSQLLSLVG